MLVRLMKMQKNCRSQSSSRNLNSMLRNQLISSKRLSKCKTKLEQRVKCIKNGINWGLKTRSREWSELKKSKMFRSHRLLRSIGGLRLNWLCRSSRGQSWLISTGWVMKWEFRN